MSNVHAVNAEADVISSKYALQVNIQAAKALTNVVKSNLGPKGTLKMLVSGAGDIRLTKDGCVLLHQMQIQHPTAALIARTATAQDDITGDGTTSNVLFTGGLLSEAEAYIADGVHPRTIISGIELARRESLEFLKSCAVPLISEEKAGIDKEVLLNVARTSLRTKVHPRLADHLAEVVTAAVLRVQRDNKIDLHMVEIQHMMHRTDMDTEFVNGIVLDHGARHPNMPKELRDCYILACNIGLEYEKTEVNSGFFYHDAKEREKMSQAEREHINKRVRAIIELKNQVCKGTKKGFIIVNQNGIDPISLDMLQKEGIIGVRRAKRRNMERIPLACGGYSINSIHSLTPECLGFAGHIYEYVLGEDKFTFIKDVIGKPKSCTILVRGPNPHTIGQIKDALRDGLRAIKNALSDNALVPGAGAFEMACSIHLDKLKRKSSGSLKLGIDVFQKALLTIPKVLAKNSGLNSQKMLILLQEKCESVYSKHASTLGQRQIGYQLPGLDLNVQRIEMKNSSDKYCGLNVPALEGIWDNVVVKRQFLHLGTIIATKLLMVDEIIRAGRIRQ